MVVLAKRLLPCSSTCLLNLSEYIYICMYVYIYIRIVRLPESNAWRQYWQKLWFNNRSIFSLASASASSQKCSCHSLYGNLWLSYRTQDPTPYKAWSSHLVASKNRLTESQTHGDLGADPYHRNTINSIILMSLGSAPRLLGDLCQLIRDSKEMIKTEKIFKTPKPWLWKLQSCSVYIKPFASELLWSCLGSFWSWCFQIALALRNQAKHATSI